MRLRDVSRAIGVVSAVPWFAGIAMIAAALWVGVHLWGRTDFLIMDVSRGQGPAAPAAMTRAEYGYFGYLSTGSAFYIDREARFAGRPSKLERVETQRVIHWLGLLETIASSVLVILAVMAVPLWVRRLVRAAGSAARVPPNSRWSGP